MEQTAEKSLEERITRLEDIESIKQLKARYCEICDDDHNPQEITTIFSEDGIWDGGGIGVAEGHAAISALFTTFAERISFSQHMVMNPIIEVNGDTATARWYFFGPFTIRTGKGKEARQAMWQSTRYVDDYVKQQGVWKYKHLRVRGRGIQANYETGWAHSENKPR